MNGNQLFYKTLSSVLQREAGNTELADQRLNEAERAIRRARINGVDDADIYYTESSIHALRGEPGKALESLQLAYERGFRRAWWLSVDWRMESLRQEPQFVAIKAQIEKDISQALSEVEVFALAVL